MIAFLTALGTTLTAAGSLITALLGVSTRRKAVVIADNVNGNHTAMSTRMAQLERTIRDDGGDVPDDPAVTP